MNIFSFGLKKLVIVAVVLMTSFTVFGRTRAEIINAGVYSPELLKLAQQDDAQAQNALGNAFKFGHGVERNLENAVFWYTKAATAGSKTAMTNLGNMYLGGLGVGQDIAKAVELYEQAALQDEQSALCTLAKLYVEGTGVEKNPEKAFEYVVRAVNAPTSLVMKADDENIDPKLGEAEFMLAAMYGDGIGTAQNPELALKYMKQAAGHGFVTACKILADMYEKGQGVPQDSGEARIWREKAARLSAR